MLKVASHTISFSSGLRPVLFNVASCMLRQCRLFNLRNGSINLPHGLRHITGCYIYNPDCATEAKRLTKLRKWASIRIPVMHRVEVCASVLWDNIGSLMADIVQQMTKISL